MNLSIKTKRLTAFYININKLTNENLLKFTDTII